MLPAWQSPPAAPYCDASVGGGVPYSIYAPDVPTATATPVPNVGETQLTGQTSEDRRDGRPGRLSINPQRLVAPVGSEVILRAGICGVDGYLMMGEPIEWTITPNSVGTIVEVDQTNKPAWRQLFHRPPFKVNGTYAVGLTSRAAQVIPRGQMGRQDDISLERGQTWISVTSPAEGATHIVAMANRLAGWEDRRSSATIHWVDGQWTLAPPQVANGSEATLCTKIVRATSGAPVAGWRVRYTIIGGTPAVFSNGDQSIDVDSDESGQACASLTAPGGTIGVTHVQMNVMTNGQGVTDIDKVSVGQGATTVTWNGSSSNTYVPPPATVPTTPTAPSMPPTVPTLPPAPTAPQLSLRVTGPETVRADEEVAYTFEIRNEDARTAENVELVNPIPRALRYVSSVPAGSLLGNQVVWQVGSIPAGQSRVIDVRYIASGAQDIRNCGTLRWHGASSIENCAESSVRLNALMIDIRGDQSAAVGETARFDIVVTNLSNQQLDRVFLEDDYDDGLFHPDGPSPLRQEEPFSLGPNQSRTFPLEFEVRGAGRLCQRARVWAEDNSQAQTSTCINSGIGDEAPLTPSPSGRAAFSVQLLGPMEMSVGGTEIVRIQITNTGKVPVTNLQIENQFDEALVPRDATPGVGREGNIIYWRLAELPVGKTATYEMRCNAMLVSPRTCHTTTVQSAEGVTESDKLCLEIFGSQQQQPGMRRRERPDTWLPGSTGSIINDPQTVARPVFIGEDTLGDTGLAASIRLTGSGGLDQEKLTYFIEIKNTRDEIEEDVVLTIETPPGTKFVTSINPPMIRAQRASNDKRTVEFLPIAALRPKESAKFRIVVRREQPTDGRFRAKITSSRLTDGIIFSDKTP